MVVAGQSFNIAINGQTAKDLEDSEAFAPINIEIRNVRRSVIGNMIKRYGYKESYDLSKADSVTLLIGMDDGYATVSDGTLYSLGTTITELTTPITGRVGDEVYMPQWKKHNDLIIVASGGRPVKIEEGNSAQLGGFPPKARFIERISDLTILAGYQDADGEYSEFRWCLPGNPEDWPAANFASVRKDGGTIKNMVALKETLYLFKEENIESWLFTSVGGTSTFVRQTSGWVDKGLGADNSVVKSNGTFYWYGNDGNFYVLQGNQAVPISLSDRKALDEINFPEQIYGFDFASEGKIRWFAPVEGKCFVYDYYNQIFTEDSAWDGSQFDRLPVMAYMELNHKQYIGDSNPTGKIYQWDRNLLDDDGKDIMVYRKLAFKPFNGARAKFNRGRIRMERGVANASVADPKVTVNWRLDRGDWGKHSKTFDIGAKGDREPWIYFYNLGIGEEIEFEILETDAVKFILTDLVITAKELSS